jgi:hypothetical protein
MTGLLYLLRAAKMFRSGKPQKLKSVFEVQLPASRQQKQKPKPKVASRSSERSLCSPSGQPRPSKILLNSSTVDLRAGLHQMPQTKVIPPITPEAKGFRVAKASTGRLLEKVDAKPDHSQNPDLLNVYLVGKQVGHDPVALKKHAELESKKIFRNWATADLDVTPSSASQEFPPLELKPYYALDMASRVSDTPHVLEVRPPEPILPGIEENQYFHDIGEIEEMTTRIGNLV